MSGTELLVTVSGHMPADIDAMVARGERPKPDYLVFRDLLGATLVDYQAAWDDATAWERQLGKLLGNNVVLALHCLKRQSVFHHVLTDGEQVGLPYALLRRCRGGQGSRHHMITHVLTVAKKRLFMSLFGLRREISTYITYASEQQRAIAQAWRQEDRVHRQHFAVDEHFFSVEHCSAPRENIICAAGWERRDYPTLIEAVKDLDTHLVIAAGSPWARHDRATLDVPIPPNVTIVTLDPVKLRDLYTRSRCVVVPLQPVRFQAGITTILEAMAMNRAVVCTRTPGQTDVIEHGVHGLYAEPQDAHSMKHCIESLLNDPDEADAMGARGRAWVCEHATMNGYAHRIQSLMHASAPA